MQIKKVGMVGCGSMGQGIVQIAAQAGYDVVTMTTCQETLERALGSVRATLDKLVEKGKITREDASGAVGRIKGTLNEEDFTDCDILIESVRETVEEKKAVFRTFDEICKPETIFTTNTSTLSIVDLGAATRRPDKFIGSHLFWPVPVMKLVEVVPSMLTSEATVQATTRFWESVGKTVAIARDTPAFIVDRLFVPFVLEAIRMLEEGVATKEDIDRAVEMGLNHPMGPLRLLDLAGVDIAYYAALSVYEQTRDPKWIPPLLLQKMMAAGHLGQKAGKGFYDYTQEK